jgi:hypothetical protein
MRCGAWRATWPCDILFVVQSFIGGIADQSSVAYLDATWTKPCSWLQQKTSFART